MFKCIDNFFRAFLLLIIKMLTSRTYITNIACKKIVVASGDEETLRFIKQLNKYNGIPLNVVYATVIYLDGLGINLHSLSLVVKLERKWLGFIKETLTVNCEYSAGKNDISMSPYIFNGDYKTDSLVTFNINPKFYMIYINIDLPLWVDYCVDIELHYLEAIVNYKSLVTDAESRREYRQALDAAQC